MRQLPWANGQVTQHACKRGVGGSGEVRAPVPMGLVERKREGFVLKENADIDGSPPGSLVPGILQARTLEWVAISFSNA